MPSWLLVCGCAFLVASGLVLLASTFVSQSPDLDDMLTRLYRRQQPTDVTAPENLHGLERVGNWVMGRTRGLPGRGTPYKDLDLLGITPQRFYSMKLIWAVIGLAFPLLLGSAVTLIGSPGMVALPAVLGLVLAVLGWSVPNLTVFQDARRARRRFGRTVTAYIDLVVLERLGGAGEAQAIIEPSRVCAAPLFVRIRQTLEQQRLERRTPWAALRQLADQINLPELSDLADTLEVSGTRSAPIAETLRSKASTIRAGYLSQDVEEAATRTQRLQAVVGAVLLFAFLAFLAAPGLMTLLAT